MAKKTKKVERVSVRVVKNKNKATGEKTRARRSRMEPKSKGARGSQSGRASAKSSRKKRIAALEKNIKRKTKAYKKKYG